MAVCEKITLGSGKLYVLDYDAETGVPEAATIEVEDNLIGYIQGGATLTYQPSFYEAKDDLGYVCKTILTEEEVTLKSGVMTWNGETLARLTSTASVTDGEGIRTVKIGGVANYNAKSYVIHFVHEDAADGNVKITIVGHNQAGFEMQFMKDKETVINAEFKALPQDKNGTLITYVEEV